MDETVGKFEQTIFKQAYFEFAQKMAQCWHGVMVKHLETKQDTSPLRKNLLLRTLKTVL